MNDEIVEKINEADVEEIPPTPIAPSAPEPNFTESEGANYAGSANSYAVESEPDEKPAKVLAIVSLICGIVSLLCCCITGLAFVCAAAAIVCGIISIKKSDSYKGMAIAGIVCGGVGLACFFIMVLSAQTLAKIIDYNDINIDDFI